ncbi:MAG: hypothetical protein WAW67_06175, partial [Candidatus Omnitrophota bacterium]
MRYQPKRICLFYYLGNIKCAKYILHYLDKIKDELKLRNYSRKTVKSYLFCLSDYFKYIKNIKREPDVMVIKKYLLAKQGRGLSSQTINRDGFVTMKIKPKISDSTRTSITSGGQITQIPIVSTSEAETTVMVKDGVTII